MSDPLNPVTILALDCSLGPAQVAVVDGRTVLAHLHCADPGQAAERLLPMVQDALVQSGISASAIKRIAVTTGPGRFTGLRIAISAARGLALAWRVPLIGISTFDVLAAARSDLGITRVLVAALDVGRGDLALCRYQHGQVIGPMSVGPAADLVHTLPPAPFDLIGPGATALFPSHPADQNGPDAAVLAQLAADAPIDRPVFPIYARPPDADLPNAADHPLIFIPQTDDFDCLAQCARIHSASFESPWTSDAITDLLKGPGVCLIAAGRRKSPAGFAMVRTVKDEAEILTLCVAPDARRRGLGQKILNSAIKMVTALGVKQLYLEVSEKNIPAINLYLAGDFLEIGRRAGYYQNENGTKDTALVLSRKIS